MWLVGLLIPYTSHLHLDFQQLPHYVTPSHPSAGDNHQNTGGRSERTQGQAKMTAWNSFSYVCTRALQSSLSFMHYRAASTVISLLPTATFTPSIQPNLGLPRIRHPLSLPSTPFCWYGTYPFIPHAQTISTHSDPLYPRSPFIL